MIENRRYYNQELNCHIIFIWYGRTPIYYRQNFINYPFQPLCSLNYTNCPDDFRSSFDILSIGSIISNVTISFNPDLLILNWGHHKTYYSNTRGGNAVHQDVINNINLLRSNGYNTTRFLFKSTTPTCETEIRHEQTNILLYCSLRYSNPLDSNLLCSQLIREGYFELYNIHEQILYLSLHTPLPVNLITNQTSYFDSYPVYWDALHPHCWVMSQLNRVLIATYFTSSRWVGNEEEKKV